ncbi:hypothetical protein HUS71_25930 [Pandoraea nosoerga]|nr:hypothetical protein [Pandoraea nosoerga]
MVEIVAGKQRAPVAAGVYNVYTGELADTATPTAARMGLEPPRFCAQCGRRMVVQVRPDVDSADLATQR